MHGGKYVAVAKIELQNSFVYVTEQIAHALFMVLIIFVFYNLWAAIYGGVATGKTISGFTLNDMLWYLVLSETVVAGSGKTQRIAKDLSEMIKSGDIVNILNKPYNLIIYNYASTIGPTVVRSAVTFAFCAAAIYLLVGGFGFRPLTAPLVLITAFLAITLQFLLYFIIGLTAFWFEDVSAFRWINEKTTFIMGGMLLPLSFFPKWLSDIASALPYSYIAYAPSYLFVHFAAGMFWRTVAAQAVWIGVLSMAALVIYKLGARKVSVNGG